MTNFEFEKDLSEIRKENHVLNVQPRKSHEDDQNSKAQLEETGRRSQENRRISNDTTPIKDKNLSKARIEDPLSEERFGKNNYSIKDKF